MPVIHVQAPGLLTTVQDLGRYGHGTLGVSPSGAADPVALRIGNLLVGNAESAAGLEMTLLGGAFLFPEAGTIAITGADFGATLDGAALPMWAACPVKPGQTLRAGPTQSGARCYLSVGGGIVVKPFLGSASTHVLTGLGGFEGRPLRKGDVLQYGDAAPSSASREVPPRLLDRLAGQRRPRQVLRTTVAPQTGLFSPAAIHEFYAAPYTVAEESNRMGLRLQGTALEAPAAGHMITEGVSLGAIQVPAGGQPILLFVEQQTTGGYPKIANVISADLPSVGQLRPRDEVRFEPVAVEAARALIREQERLLAGLSSSFRSH